MFDIMNINIWLWLKVPFVKADLLYLIAWEFTRFIDIDYLEIEEYIEKYMI